MKDSILKGTGNSRFLKSAVPAGTSWADALAMLQAGTFPIDFNGINTEGFQQVGTPLNKANLLKDATAAQIGLPPSTTPDGMFQALAKTGDLHVWRKTVTTAQEIPAKYELGELQTGNFQFVGSNYVTWEYGTPNVGDDGTVSLVSLGSSNVNYSSNLNDLRGKYCKPNQASGVFLANQVIFIPSDAVFTQSGSAKYISKYQPVIGTPKTPAGTTTTYPVSTNPNAYKEGDDAKEAGYTLGDAKRIVFYSGNDRLGFNYGDAITVSDDGKTIDIKNPSYQEWYSSNINNVTVMSGKFMRFTFHDNTDYGTSNPVYFMPSTSKMEYDSDYNVSAVVQPVTGYAAIPAGTTIEYLGKLGGKARVRVVSYVGTGTYGKDNPCSITADFKINTILFLSSLGNNGNMLINNYATRAMIGDVLTTEYVASRGFSDQNSSYPTYGKKSADGKTFSWYHEYNSSYQCNNSGFKYYYLVISN